MSEKKKVYKCGACDATVNDSDKFCTKCGIGLELVGDELTPQQNNLLERTSTEFVRLAKALKSKGELDPEIAKSISTIKREVSFIQASLKTN